MKLDQKDKENLFKQFGKEKSERDTGSPESQIALFTHKITHLTEHLKKHKKDHATRLGLVKLVGKRKGLLDYLKKCDLERYRKIVASLALRK